MANLYAEIGEMIYDGLVSDKAPQVIVGGGVVAGLTSGTADLKRGAVLSKDSATGKLSLMASGATADCVLCDDLTLGADDVNVAVYTSGCFDPDKVSVADGYALTETDRDTLRTKNIYFKAKA